jgi:hypothetical protein
VSDLALAKTTGGVAAACGAVVGDALGRPVNGHPPAVALALVGTAPSGGVYLEPSPQETDPVREALPGTPSAASMRGLALLEALAVGPEEPGEAVEDALRRVALLGLPGHAQAPRGALLGPSGPLRDVVAAWAGGRAPLSCASEEADAGLLVAAAMLGAAGAPLPRAACLLRATCRCPVTLASALTLAEVTRVTCTGSLPSDGVLEAARAASEQALGVVAGLPGTLGGPPQRGHSAVTMSLARAGHATDPEQALAELGRDASGAPEVVLGAVLAAHVLEGGGLARHAGALLRLGGASSAALAALCALATAREGMKVAPLSWLGGLRLRGSLHAYVDVALGGTRRPARLAFPAADLCWAWQRDEAAFHASREESRRSRPPPTRAEQMGLFGGAEPAPSGRRRG